MEFIPESNEVIKEKLENIIGKPKQNRIKLISKYGLGSALIGLVIVGVGIGWSFIGNTQKNDVISQLFNNQKENETTNNQENQKFGLARLIERQLETEYKLPREDKGLVLKRSVYTLFSGNIRRRGLGYSGRINDGTAREQIDSEFQKNFLIYSQPDSKILAMDKSGKIISEATLTFIQSNKPVQSEQGDWIAVLWMPESTASVELTRNGTKIDKIYVDNRVPTLEIGNLPKEVNNQKKLQVGVETDDGFEMYRINIEMFDQARNKSYELINSQPINAAAFVKEIDLTKSGINWDSKYILTVRLSTPFVVNQMKSNEFIYRAR